MIVTIGSETLIVDLLTTDHVGKARTIADRTATIRKNETPIVETAIIDPMRSRVKEVIDKTRSIPTMIEIENAADPATIRVTLSLRRTNAFTVVIQLIASNVTVIVQIPRADQAPRVPDPTYRQV